MIQNVDCREGMRTLADCSVDSIVTDPPYELGFMSKKWDKTGIAYDADMWRECLRVLKPGGYLLAFSSSRTYHRMTCAIEDSGFDIRDQIMWVYGSGFPKNKNALKPAHEPICVARKPLSEKTVASNVLKHGTGALNIDGCRVPIVGDRRSPMASDGTVHRTNLNTYKFTDGEVFDISKDRYPANLIHDGLDEEWSRYFYCAKTSKKDRNEGLEDMELKENIHGSGNGQGGLSMSDSVHPNQNHHPTVKPTELMRYLCRLVTPPNGLILDPFAGSGSTGKAAALEGFQFVGFELEPEYVSIAEARIAAAKLCANL